MKRLHDLPDFQWYVATAIISYVIAMSVVWIPLGILILSGVIS